jgi:hypothetical protein
MDNANETDVREEVAAPLIKLLGYERGTPNDVLRERTLTYDRAFLGRKKKTDPPLRGRADYELVVTGAGRWTLEVKAPSEDITQDVVEQAITYARHPEVAGTYAVVLNGRTLAVYLASATVADGLLTELAVESPEQLAEELTNLLSPAAIRRDCRPPIVDLGKSLAEGLRSTVAIAKGTITYETFAWESNLPLPAAVVAELNEAGRWMIGRVSSITGGKVWRDDASRIRATLLVSPPHAEMLRFMQDKKLLDIEYVSLSPMVSSDPAQPTVFDAVGSVTVSEGEQVFDIRRWQSMAAGVETSMTYRGQGTGTIKDGCFAGTFRAEYETIFPVVPGLCITMIALGTFELQLDGR